ncbi:TetR/AcrR family transcriptional regulator C-terminal ligand-binding domain-containing protein [uncultured Thalassospira sp.]|jgi:AcrR family transcriptional regulator|uniref:TetR/AcrR family transcriptional regulator n=1 Tax=uncultured Thalassospira sp. TaxID=404382 RepID=UPI0030DD774C|tara:strand:- start:160 stop:732 length:573 start_codon:yes stop_codon:yes gene_type:complete
MAINKGIRTGGRSARVQQSIHAAVKSLLDTYDRADVTVPMIAQQAGVTPSTIYRRWGDISTLLADVALERFDLDDTLPDTGDFRCDVLDYAEQYFDEMNSDLGRSMLRNMIASDDNSSTLRCVDMLTTRLGELAGRAAARGETVPATDFLIDGIFAPMVYRILFSSIAPDNAYVRGLVDRCLPPEQVVRF